MSFSSLPLPLRLHIAAQKQQIFKFQRALLLSKQSRLQAAETQRNAWLARSRYVAGVKLRREAAVARWANNPRNPANALPPVPVAEINFALDRMRRRRGDNFASFYGIDTSLKPSSSDYHHQFRRVLSELDNEVVPIVKHLRAPNRFSDNARERRQYWIDNPWQPPSEEDKRRSARELASVRSYHEAKERDARLSFVLKQQRKFAASSIQRLWRARASRRAGLARPEHRTRMDLLRIGAVPVQDGFWEYTF